MPKNDQPVVAASEPVESTVAVESPVSPVTPVEVAIITKTVQQFKEHAKPGIAQIGNAMHKLVFASYKSFPSVDCYKGAVELKSLLNEKSLPDNWRVGFKSLSHNPKLNDMNVQPVSFSRSEWIALCDLVISANESIAKFWEMVAPTLATSKPVASAEPIDIESAW